MMRRGSNLIGTTGFVILMFALGACNQDSTVATPPMLARSAPTSTTQRNPVGDATAFHARNRFDWAGKAHNSGVRQFIGALTSQKYVSETTCEVFLDFFDNADLSSPGMQPLSQAERRAATIRGLRSAGITDCPPSLEAVSKLA